MKFFRSTFAVVIAIGVLSACGGEPAARSRISRLTRAFSLFDLFKKGTETKPAVIVRFAAVFDDPASISRDIQ